jgi:hypothetical protein
MSLIVPKMRADDVYRALKRIYGGPKVLFLKEVKTGPTWFSDGLMRFDALSIKKSWTKPCISGYEIKVSRADFMQDEKWPGYLEYCHRFYFACPSGLIKPEELDDRVGLVWINEKGGARVRKKALFRDVEPPVSLFYHLVISHMNPSEHPFFSSAREECEAYLADKLERYELGRKVKTKMMTEVKEAKDIMKKAERKVMDHEDDLKLFKEVREVLHKHGLGWSRSLAERLNKHLNQLRAGDEIDKIKKLRDSINEILSDEP